VFVRLCVCACAWCCVCIQACNVARSLHNESVLQFERKKAPFFWKLQILVPFDQRAPRDHASGKTGEKNALVIKV